MARPLRNTDPEKIRLITIRTEGATLLLRPDSAANETLGGIIAKYQELFQIEIFALVVLSNHYHMLVRAPRGNLWRFLQAINREIARRTNRLRRRQGHFWRRRYDEQVVIREEDALEALLYIVTNPVHHGLVDHPRHWPGLLSYPELLGGKPRAYCFTNYTAYERAKRSAQITAERVRIEDFQTTHELVISALPQFAKKDTTETKGMLSELLAKRVQQLVAARKRAGGGFLGRKGILRQSPFGAPRKVSNSPRPTCYTKCTEAKRAFMETYRLWVSWYRKASLLFRAGYLTTTFPPYSIPPSLLYSVAPT